MDRRQFIFVAGALCGAPAALAGCASSLRYVDYAQEGNRLVVRQADVKGAHVLIENPQGPRAISLNRLDDGSFSAVSTRCTHKGCPVEPAGDRLTCSCHGSEFTYTGEVLRGPAETPLARYPVTSDGEYLYIELPETPAE